MKISIFIINYNNGKLLSRCINSVLGQNYFPKEVIIFDDCSNDNSRKIINKFKGVKKIFNKKKLKSGSQSQINGIRNCLKKCNGEVICFLDSDDFFQKNKLKKIAFFFRKNLHSKIVTDKEIYFYKKNRILKNTKKINSSRFLRYPKFPPQSCISVRKKYLKSIIEDLSIRKFDSVWFDFRILIFSFIKYGKVDLINENLTYYQQSSNSVSQKYKKFSIDWWHRRLDAHQFVFYLMKKYNIFSISFLFDFLITKVVCSINKLSN